MESMSEAFNVVSYDTEHHFKQEKPKSTASCLEILGDVSVSLRAKRKRGRPRKDSNLSREGSLQSPENSTLVKTQRVELIYPTPDGIKITQEVDKNSKDGINDAMVGSMVYGVIEGSFDAGYLIAVKIGNNQTPFRGVVFQPRKFVPITAANDIAPQAKMYQRREFSVPVYDNVNQTSGSSPQPVPASKQAVLRPILPSIPLSVTPYSSSNHSPEAMMLRTSSCSNMGGKIAIPKSPNVGVCKQFSYVHPTGSLRMVEEDEVMQAFEVSTSSGGSRNNIVTSGDMVSESLLKATTNSFPGKESINQKPDQVHGKVVESGLGPSTLIHNKPEGSGSNVEVHHNPVEDMPRSAFEIQQDEMICHEMEHPREFVHNGLQSPTIELQQIPAAAQSHSVPTEPQGIKTEVQPSNLYYNELRSPDVNFHQDLFTDQSQPDSREPKSLAAAQFHPGNFVDRVSKSPNLKLDLAFTVHEKPPEPQASAVCLETNYSVLNGMKNPNLGYHQALVAGNPLLLPPDLTGEPLEFMMEKTKSPPNYKTPEETKLEMEPRVIATGERFHSAAGEAEAAASPSASYKLELSTPQSALNRRPSMQVNSSAGCINDMDFVLCDDIQPTESNSHRNDPFETKNR